MTNEEWVVLDQKLETIIRLLAHQIGAGQTLQERAPVLSRLGLNRHQIAAICNTNPEVVSVRLAEAKRASKRTRTRGPAVTGGSNE